MMKSFLPISLIFLSGCLWHAPVDPVDPDLLYEDRLAHPRTERRLSHKELVLAVAEGPESGREIALAEAALKTKGFQLKVIRVSGREALSAMVRACRADLMAGAFTSSEIRSMRLLPVLPYAGADGRSRYCFAVRRSDHILENMLGPVSSEDSDGRKGP